MKFGEIVLKFGATGMAGEQPLRIQTGHINLIVGPNNAGKSLMLRELSGLNPRERRRSTKHKSLRIVESVAWADAVTRKLQEEIIANAFSGEEKSWQDIAQQPWASLVPALDQAIVGLVEIRSQFTSQLADWAKKESLPDNLAQFVADLPDRVAPDVEPTLVHGAAIILSLSWVLVASTPSSVSPTPLEVTKQSHLSAEQITQLESLFEQHWTLCQDLLEPLYPGTSNTSIRELLDLNVIFDFVVGPVSIHPILGPMLAAIPAVSESINRGADESKRLRRMVRIAKLLLDPQPFIQLRKFLDSAFRKLSWANDALRARFASGCLYLDGLARLEMTKSALLKRFDDDSDSPILTLLQDPKGMDRLRELVADALGAYLVVDMTTEAPQVIWRLSAEEPDAGLEATYSKEANDFHSQAPPLDERSDGIHAFVGMLAAILAKRTDLVFIDEPEAFLHPPLVRKFARQLATISREFEGQFFVATHNADLLASCVSSGVDVNIIRLTYDDERATARQLDATGLRKLALDPLLRSESVLSALFHYGAVVTEGATDRLIYNEVNERLLAADDEGGIESCVFLNAQNWQTEPRMIKPLREMGVAAAAVLDADVLFGADLTTILTAAQIPKAIYCGLLSQRDSLRKMLVQRLAWKPGDDHQSKFKGEVVAGLTSDERAVFDHLRQSLGIYGVFIVPVGEVEDWFAPLGVVRIESKKRWLENALQRLGWDPESEDYVWPADDDIWQFMREVSAWITDPKRKGTGPAPM